MNFDKLFAWIVGVVIAFASIGKLEVLQSWIWKTQVKVIYESRTSNWGSPRFFSSSAKAHVQHDRKRSTNEPKR